uniref:Uncharacterized protein n=1 Tax=Siphoviridae sp. ctsi73 TaxID=2825698 RepID=A0A8S5QH89_9CAUD|nr:MAG TPA: hypothetical protein [Siphoviridae sp. ctsi73]
MLRLPDNPGELAVDTHHVTHRQATNREIITIHTETNTELIRTPRITGQPKLRIETVAARFRVKHRHCQPFPKPHRSLSAKPEGRRGKPACSDRHPDRNNPGNQPSNPCRRWNRPQQSATPDSSPHLHRCICFASRGFTFRFLPPAA